jgi:deoxyribodipyrimidine photo-lyase
VTKPDEPSPTTVVWFRRDLRVHDHPALTAAAIHGAVAPLFVLDPAILRGRFASPNRTWFLLGAIDSLGSALAARGARLSIRVGRPVDVVLAFARDVAASRVALSRDYTPFGRRRDAAVARALQRDGVEVVAEPGLLVHEPESMLTDAGRPSRVFTPFLRRWMAADPRDVLPAPRYLRPSIDPGGPTLPFASGDIGDLDVVARLGTEPPTADSAALPRTGEEAARDRLDAWLAAGPHGGPAGYASRRDRLDDAGGTSRLGPDLRFGLLSPIEIVTRVLSADGASVGSRRFVSELAWRDFYAHVLFHDPDLAHSPFQRRFASVAWPGGSLGDPPTDPIGAGAADAWRAGRTGFPIVDAGMRQLLATGYLHNRARMIVASFLSKDLLIDWRVGEAHFMRHLLDGDPASNLGGWQWAASVGTDAQPYFRVFNPVTQAERFDPDGDYVRRWVPELRRVPLARLQAPWTMTSDEQIRADCRIGTDYPAPTVDHAAARVRAIAWFRDHGYAPPG